MEAQLSKALLDKQAQQEEWAKNDETYRCRECDFKELLQAVTLEKNRLATEKASSNQQTQAEEWDKKEEAYQCREHDLEEQLQVAIVEKDCLTTEASTGLLRIQ